MIKKHEGEARHNFLSSFDVFQSFSGELTRNEWCELSICLCYIRRSNNLMDLSAPAGDKITNEYRMNSISSEYIYTLNIQSMIIYFLSTLS
jgi:hypothetical protein